MGLGRITVHARAKDPIGNAVGAFGTPPAKPGDVILVNWDLDGPEDELDQFIIRVTTEEDVPLEIKRYSTGLIGQVMPFNGTWTFPIPNGVEPGIWRVIGYARHKNTPPDSWNKMDSGGGRMVITDGPAVQGVMVEKIMVLNEFKK